MATYVNTLPVKTELYAADGHDAQQITLDKKGHKLVHVVAYASALTHTFTFEYSYDNTNWYTFYVSPVAEQIHSETVEVPGRYLRLSSSAHPSVTADSVDLILAAIGGTN